MKELADIMKGALMSPAVGSHDEPANVVDVLDGMRRALHALGTHNAATSMGAIELHAKETKEASERIADALHDVADAIRERK